MSNRTREVQVNFIDGSYGGVPLGKSKYIEGKNRALRKYSRRLTREDRMRESLAGVTSVQNTNPPENFDIGSNGALVYKQ